MTSSRARLHEDSNFRQNQNRLGHVYLQTGLPERQR
jgi:hypothetical protein